MSYCGGVSEGQVRGRLRLGWMDGPVFFQTAIPCFGDYHPKRGGMVGTNCERVQLLKIKVLMPSTWAKWCTLMIVCVLSDLT